MPRAFYTYPLSWWRSFTARPLASRVRRCLLLSLVFMLAGHVAVIMSGAVFDLRTGEWYHPARRWVSDFAAKWPEGVLIKISIALFCVALADFFYGTAQRCRRGFSLLKFAWLVCAAAMIGGLILVAVFDMSPAQYQQHRFNFLFRLVGRDRLVQVPLSTEQWAMRAQHQLGFRLFVAGFFVSAVTLAWLEWRSGRRSRLPVTAAILLAALGFAVWLLATRTVLPGIPQRGLLLLMFVWLLREARRLTYPDESRCNPRGGPFFENEEQPVRR